MKAMLTGGAFGLMLLSPAVIVDVGLAHDVDRLVIGAVLVVLGVVGGWWLAVSGVEIEIGRPQL